METADGSILVENVRAGDKLLARSEFDPAGEATPRAVEEVFVRFGAVWRLEVGGRDVFTTPEHPFFEAAKGWVPCQELAVGDRLLCRDGSWVAVGAVEDTGRWETVYNFRIAEDHTYFVGCPEWGFGVWAHNQRYLAKTEDKKAAASWDTFVATTASHLEQIGMLKTGLSDATREQVVAALVTKLSVGSGLDPSSHPATVQTAVNRAFESIGFAERSVPSGEHPGVAAAVRSNPAVWLAWSSSVGARTPFTRSSGVSYLVERGVSRGMHLDTTTALFAEAFSHPISDRKTMVNEGHYKVGSRPDRLPGLDAPDPANSRDPNAIEYLHFWAFENGLQLNPVELSPITVFAGSSALNRGVSGSLGTSIPNMRPFEVFLHNLILAGSPTERLTSVSAEIVGPRSMTWEWTHTFGKQHDFSQFIEQQASLGLTSNISISNLSKSVSFSLSPASSAKTLINKQHASRPYFLG